MIGRLSQDDISTVAFAARAHHHSDVALLCRISTTDLYLSLGMRVPADDCGFTDVWIARADIDRNSEVKERGSVGLLRISRALARSIALQLAGRKPFEHARHTYLELVKTFHPDKCPGDSAALVAMKAINLLWESIEAAAPVEPLTTLPGGKL